MPELTAQQKPKRPFWSLILVFFSMSILILNNGPDPIQRMLLLLALIIAHIDVMRGLAKTSKNWLVNGLFAYYQLLMILTFVVIVRWENSVEFWKNAPKYTFGVILFSLLFGGYYAIKARGAAKNLAESIRTPGVVFGTILLWQIVAQVGIRFAPEVSIAQLCAVIIPLGFIAQPFAPSQPLPFAPFLTLKRLSGMIVILVVLAEWLLQ